ncbi:hypothetical protein [Burkholderia multivorans]|uniref:hypothetical protein n=1 Tax=Burkholderia multivorans TaxID=87883 RepID=UPI0015E3EA97|nr:hypothetical protein [Burkholderia multivorans]MBY4791618.1 hypothetical protein [Burkholderia multivorans]
MKIYGAAAIGAIFETGVMVYRHVPPGWRMQRNPAAGVAMCAAVGSLIVTGYAVY